MNAYSAQAAANQGQQNNGSQTPAPNGHVANEYLSKPPIYYNTFNSINNANNVQNNANTNKNMMGYDKIDADLKIFCYFYWPIFLIQIQFRSV